jgi:hypothetical protein
MDKTDLFIFKDTIEGQGVGERSERENGKDMRVRGIEGEEDGRKRSGF